MEKYMGIRRETGPLRPARELPWVDIAGTMFRVDIGKREFRVVNNPYNRMPFEDVREEYGFCVLLFDTKAKNRYINTAQEPGQLPDYVQMIIVPPLKELDPVGLARLHGFSDDYYSKKQEAAQPQKATVFKRESNQSNRKGRKGPSI